MPSAESADKMAALDWREFTVTGDGEDVCETDIQLSSVGQYCHTECLLLSGGEGNGSEGNRHEGDEGSGREGNGSGENGREGNIVR